MKYVLEGTPFGQNIVLKKARESVMKQTHGNYPSPLKIIDVVEVQKKKRRRRMMMMMMKR